MTPHRTGIARVLGAGVPVVERRRPPIHALALVVAPLDAVADRAVVAALARGHRRGHALEFDARFVGTGVVVDAVSRRPATGRLRGLGGGFAFGVAALFGAAAAGGSR